MQPRSAILLAIVLLVVPVLPAAESGVSVTMTGGSYREYAENFEPAGTAGQSSACCAAGVPPSDAFYTVNVVGTGTQIVSATTATGSTQAWQVTDTSAPYMAQLVNTGAGVNLCTSPQSLEFDFNTPILASSLSAIEYRMSNAAAVTAAMPANSFGISITKVIAGTGNLYSFFLHGNTGALVSTTPATLAAGLHHLKVSSVACTSPAAATFQLDSLPPASVASAGDTLAGTYNRMGVGNTGSVSTAGSIWLDNYDYKFAPLPAPTITSVSPNIGQKGTGFLIKGAGFAPGATVLFGSQSATVTAVSSTQITGTAPKNAVGTVSVTVTNPDTQSATLANAFQYVPPTFTGVCPTSPPTALNENFGTYEIGETPARCWYVWSSQGLDSVGVANDTYLPQALFPVGNTGTANVAAAVDGQSMKVVDASPGAMFYSLRGFNFCGQLGSQQLPYLVTAFRIDASTNSKLLIGVVDDSDIATSNPAATDSKGKAYLEFQVGAVPVIHLKGLASSDATATASGGAITANTWYTVQFEMRCRSISSVPGGVPAAYYSANAGVNDLLGNRVNDATVTGVAANRPAASVNMGSVFFSNQAIAGGASSMTFHQDVLSVNGSPQADRTIDVPEGIKGWETSRDDTTVQIVRSSSANCNGVTDGNGNSYAYSPNTNSCQKITTYNNQFTVIGGPDQAEFCGSQFYGVAAQKSAIAVVATNCSDPGELDIMLRSPYGNGASNPANQLSNPPPGINDVGSPNFAQSSVQSKICLVGSGPGCGPNAAADPNSGSQCVPCNPLEIGPMAEAPWNYASVERGDAGRYCGLGEGQATAVTTGVAFGMAGGIGAFALTQRGCSAGRLQFSNYVKDAFGASGTIPSQICTWSWPGRNPTLHQGGSSAGAIDWIAAVEPGYGASVWQLETTYQYQNRGDGGLSSEPEAFVKIARRYDFTNPLLTDANSVACAADKMVIGTQTHGIFLVQPFNEPGRPAAGSIYGSAMPGSVSGEPTRNAAISPSGQFGAYSTGAFLYVVDLSTTSPAVIGALYDPSTQAVALPFNSYRLDAQANYLFVQDATRLYRIPISVITHGGVYTPDPNPDDNTHCYGSTDGSGVPDCWNPCPGQHKDVQADGRFTCPDGSTWSTTVLKSCATNPDQPTCTEAATKQACDIDPKSGACQVQKANDAAVNPPPGSIGGIFGGAASGFGILGGSKESGGVWVCILLILALMAIGAAMVPGKGGANLLGAGVGGGLGFVLCIVTNLLSPIIVFAFVLLAGALTYFKFFHGGGEQ